MACLLGVTPNPCCAGLCLCCAKLSAVAAGATTQPVETVIAILATSRDGASINAAAKTPGINYRTAQQIVEAAAAYRQRQLAAVG